MTPDAPAWCYRCGRPLQRIHGTAYVRCARTIHCGRDYWIHAVPGWLSVLHEGVRYSVMVAP